MNIYKIKEKYDQILSKSLSFDEETPQTEVDDWLAEMLECEGELDDKIDSIVYHKKNQENRKAGIEEEIKRLTEASKAEQKRCDRTDKLLISVLGNLGKTEIETALNKVKMKENKGKFEVSDLFDFGDCNKDIKAIEKLNKKIEEHKNVISEAKKEAKKAIEKGEKVENCNFNPYCKLIIK